jgi:RNA polymerase sigma-70 factor (ECF subfamily)
MPPDPQRTSDEDLLRSFLDGSEAAFTELMRRHEDRIFSLAMRMTGNRADALDATQETFIQAFRKATKFRGDSAFGTWLWRIGTNACHDILRKRKRAPIPAEEPAAEEIAPGAPRLDDEVTTRLELGEALAQLSEEYREAVVMHDLGGIPYEEIATLTGVSIGTVKSRISRGRKRLGGLLEQAGSSRTSKDLR